MKPAPRLNWIDYARGIAIILVTYRHVFEGVKAAGIPVGNFPFLEYINIFFYSFRMPLFFIVSGIFISRSFKKRGLLNYIEARAKMILYPYFIWGFMQLTLQMFFTKYTNGHPTPAAYLHLLYLPREIGQFWYLYALFNVSILYVFSKQLKFTVVYNIIIGLIFFYISALVYQYDIKIGFLSDILHNYIFFAIGDLVSNYLLDRKNHKYFESGKILLLMLIPFAAVQFYFLMANLQQQIQKYMFVEYYQPFIFLLIAIIGCAFIINLTFFLQKKDRLKWLTYVGRHSLYIYVAQVIAFAGLRIFLTNVLHIQNIFIILITGIIAGVCIPLLLYRLAVKLNMRWIFTLEKEDSTEVKKPVTAAVAFENRANNL
ncbi:MAG: acyltransferase [Ferruginibacter sp.]